jgi:ATPase subunit of ABC transporter with duplicated ATPase domains
MLTINAITVRLGGRPILERASAAIPPGSRVGLIGRNGAGKSTLMKAIIGQIDPDEGTIELPRRTRLGYIAQEAPAGAASPFETVLAADTERARDGGKRKLRRSPPARRHPRAAAGDRRLFRSGARGPDPARARL